MPIPRMHGGAALEHISLNLPAFKGLNRTGRAAVLGPEWATKSENTVLDSSNRLASRKGWVDQTASTPLTDAITVTYEFLNGSTYEIIAVTDALTIHKSVDAGANWTDITGTATVTDDNMDFAVNNSILYGFQDSGTMIVYAGTSFVDSTATTDAPDGNVALGAFGRLWAKDTATSLKYCALLDGDDWTSSDTGGIDLTSVWQQQDEITALAEFNGALVIFSERNIIVYTDNAGSALGIDPTQIIVVDTISGIGTLARDSVVNVKGDLWFLDSTGVHSLGRLLQEKSNPLNNISRNVQDDLQDQIVLTSDTTRIRAAYSPSDRFYLLSLPAGSGANEIGRAYVFDTRGFLEDGSARCTGIWDGLVPQTIVPLQSRDLALTYRAQEGRVGFHDGYNDAALTYIVDYESGWSNLGVSELKILKRMTVLMFLVKNSTVTMKWSWDFTESFASEAITFSEGGGAGATFNGTALFNVSLFGAGNNLREKSIAGSGTGEYIKVGLTTTIDGTEVALQQLNVYAKIGRLK